MTEPGFGSYWTVNLTAPPGTKRPRKRGRSNIHENNGLQTAKRRGRPRKPISEPDQRPYVARLALNADRTLRKCPISPSQSVSEQGNEDGREERLSDYGKSDDEFESEEDMDYSYHPSSLTARSPFAANDIPRGLQPLVPASFATDVSGTFVDQMKIEIEGLRRQTGDLQSTTIRLSDQLSEAHADVSRAKAAQKAAEIMLEREQRKRIEAEKVVRELKLKMERSVMQRDLPRECRQ